MNDVSGSGVECESESGRTPESPGKSKSSRRNLRLQQSILIMEKFCRDFFYFFPSTSTHSHSIFRRFGRWGCLSLFVLRLSSSVTSVHGSVSSPRKRKIVFLAIKFAKFSNRLRCDHSLWVSRSPVDFISRLGSRGKGTRGPEIRFSSNGRGRPRVMMDCVLLYGPGNVRGSEEIQVGRGQGGGEGGSQPGCRVN